MEVCKSATALVADLCIWDPFAPKDVEWRKVGIQIPTLMQVLIMVDLLYDRDT